jgi:MFS family permease
VPLFTSLQNFAWAITLRFLNGIATGAFDSVSLNWSAESADHWHRGRIVGLTMGCAAFGASQAYFLVYGIGKDTRSEVVWRFPLAYQLVFVLLILGSFPFLPESPRWLIQNRFVHEAREILLALNADRGTPEEVKAQVESNLSQIERALSEEATVSSHTSYYDMLLKPGTVYSLPCRTWSAIFVQFATQAMIGAGVTSGYGTKIFAAGG